MKRQAANLLRSFLIATLTLSLSAPLAIAAPIEQNLLTNPGFESPPTTGWAIAGSWGQGSSGPSAYQGSYYLRPTSPVNSTIYQEIDLASLGFDINRLATGGYRARVDGYIHSNYLDSIGTISLQELLSDGSSNGSTGIFQSNLFGWRSDVKYVGLEPGTTKLAYVFTAQNTNPAKPNTASLDAASLEISEYYIWTYGNVTSSKHTRSNWTTSNSYYIAASGTGEINVTRNKIWTTSGVVNVADDHSTIGNVNINSGTWQANDEVYLGDLGDAFVNITNNGTWNATKDVVLTQWSSGESTVNVIDGQWNSSSLVQIGKHGNGKINIGAGGTWNSSGEVRTNDVDIAKRYAEINVNGGHWSASGKNYIGMTLDGDYVDAIGISKVNVTNSGQWTTSNETYLGHSTLGKAAVTLDNSTWTSGAAVHVGYEGEASVTLKNGKGWTSNQDVFISRMYGAEGTVDITGATWTANDNVNLGYGGRGQLTIGAGGTLATTTGIVYVGRYEDAKGTVNIDGGTWTDDANGTFIGDFGAGTVNITNGGAWNSSSNVEFGYGYGGRGGTVNLTNGSWKASDSVNIGMNSPGTLNIDPNGTWTTQDWAGIGRAASGKVTVNGGTWNAEGTTGIGSSYAEGDVVIKNNGQLDMTGELTIYENGTLRLESGTIHFDGTWTNDGEIKLPGGQLVVKHSGTLGNTELTGGQLSILGSTTTVDAGNVTVGAASSMKIDQNATVTVGSGKTLNVNGTIQIPNGDGTIKLNNGLLTHAQKTLNLNGGTIQGNGQVFVGTKGLNLGVAGTLAGTSPSSGLTVWGNVSGSGDLMNVILYGNLDVGNSPGVISADGLTLMPSGTLTMEIGGLIAGTQHDQVQVDGLFNLDGTLKILGYDNFEAGRGDAFTLFNLSPGGSLVGQFTSVILPVFSDSSLSWDLSSLYSNGTITVTPEPMCWTLLLSMGVVMLARRLRRTRKT